MILVILGTQDKPFNRLLEAIDQYIDKTNSNEEFIVQAGTTKYTSQNMKVFDFIPVDQFDEFIKKADVIITHAGVGSILSAITLRKKVIAVARLSKFGEHTNDHQLEILEQFDKSNYIYALYDLSKLDKALNEIKDFQPQEYISNALNMINFLNSYIESLD